MEKNHFLTLNRMLFIRTKVFYSRTKYNLYLYNTNILKSFLSVQKETLSYLSRKEYVTLPCKLIVWCLMRHTKI